MTRPRVVFASHVHPESPSGGGVYTAGVLALLRAVWGAERVRAVHPPPDAPVPAQAGSVAEGLLRGLPSKVAHARRSGLAEALRAGPEAMAADIVCLNGPDCAWVLDGFVNPGARVILVCHNIEARLFADRAAELAPLPRALVGLTRDAARYTAWEERAFARAGLVLAISDQDAAEVRARHPGTPVLHLPPVFAGRLPEPPRARTGQRGPLRLGFLGKTGWWPNREAVDWLTGEILDPMPEGRVLHLFGPGSERWHAPGRGITGHGLVADLRTVWQGIDLMLCPVRRGGGVNVKFAESLFNGMAVLATPFSARGLGLAARDRPGLRFLEDAAAWRAFLSGPEADRLAAERPDDDLRARFAAGPESAERLGAAARDAGLPL